MPIDQMNVSNRHLLEELLWSGIKSVTGQSAVETAIATGTIKRPTRVIALGKAALSMVQGLPASWQTDLPTLLVTKTDHLGQATLGPNVTALETSHPVPDETSIKAGQAAIDFVSNSAPEDTLLVLVSGGASSLVEALEPPHSFEDLIALTRGALSDGADIAEINTRRRSISAIKGGKLLARFPGQHVDVLAISDVEGDGIDVIGSGIGQVPRDMSYTSSTQIIGSNAVARSAVEQAATAKGLTPQFSQEVLYCDVAEAADRVASTVQDAAPGLYIFGGEPTVQLPEHPGEGGRNQALALEIAQRIAGRQDVCVLVAGTDGTDGPTEAAGAVVDGTSFHQAPGAAEALAACNSGAFLRQTGDLLITGPTGTNVMDLALVLKLDAP